jgi:hypothetical protein
LGFTKVTEIPMTNVEHLLELAVLSDSNPVSDLSS